MPVRVENAKRPAHDPVLPDALTAGTLLLAGLNQSGLLGKLGSVFKVSRRGGYSGLPLVAFALAYLAGDQGLGIRPYWTTFKSALKRVAVGCPIRSQCFSSTRPNMYKQISRSVSPIDAAEMVAFLAKHPPTRKMRQIRPAPPRPTRRTAASARVIRHLSGQFQPKHQRK
ncbi:MAG: hypothetical protein ABMA64_23280 [Myxococcota bacterium]